MNETHVKEVTKFIDRRFGKFPKEYWNTGNCYYFTIILCERFYYLKPYYDPIEGHFWAGNGEWFFDISRCFKKENFKEILSLDTIKIQEPEWYNRLMEDCVK